MPSKKKNEPKAPNKKDQVLYRPEAPSHSKSKVYFKDKRYYFNIHVRRWKRHIPGTWDNGPLIYKVPLNPEQAVLSCCSFIAEAIHFQETPSGVCVRTGAASTPCNVLGGGKDIFCEQGNWGTGQDLGANSS